MIPFLSHLAINCKNPSQIKGREKLLISTQTKMSIQRITLIVESLLLHFFSFFAAATTTSRATLQVAIGNTL